MDVVVRRRHQTSCRRRGSTSYDVWSRRPYDVAIRRRINVRIRRRIDVATGRLCDVEPRRLHDVWCRRRTTTSIRRHNDVAFDVARRRLLDVFGSRQKESPTTSQNDVYRPFTWRRPDVWTTSNFLEGSRCLFVFHSTRNSVAAHTGTQICVSHNLSHSANWPVQIVVVVIHLELLWLLGPVLIAVVATGLSHCCRWNGTKTCFEVPFNRTFVFEAFTT